MYLDTDEFYFEYKVIYHICDSFYMIEEKCYRKNKIQRTFGIFHILIFN